jgi:copper chaperone CopZ
MAVGVPLYVCATASTPIALGLIHAGLSPGAAIAFLISGPATNGAALATLWRVLGRRTAVIYLVTVALAAIGSGLLVDSLITSADVPATALVRNADASAGLLGAGEHEHHEGGGPWAWFGHASAVVLLLVLVNAMRPRRRAEQGAQEETSAPPPPDRVELQVSGMRCNGCVQSLERALGEVAGVRRVTVDLDSGTATVEGPAEHGALAAAVTSLGFTLEGQSEAGGPST